MTLQKKTSIPIKNGTLHVGDALNILPTLQPNSVQLIIADPPYFQVLLQEKWDNAWISPENYLHWSLQWIQLSSRLLTQNGLLYLFGQLGKREHIWIHLCSALTKSMQFHDMLVWDRVVGYNDRSDSFTPQYEMILVLRKSLQTKPYFNKNAVRTPYDNHTIQNYLKDKRYKNKKAREDHLEKGKFATNILKIPSLKGSSKEKVGHPAQKPLALIEQLVTSSSLENSIVLDPFLGSGTTAIACEKHRRKWIGIEKEPKYVDIARKRIENLSIQPKFNFD